MRRAALLLLLVAGCGETVDTTGLASIDGYDQWFSVTLTGEVPGHLSGRRVVYVNEAGRAYGHAGRYRPGTVLVKEIFETEDASDPEYISVMRKIADSDPAGTELPLDAGWLFTDVEGDEEVHRDWCWSRCHQAATYDGAWYDYGAP